MVVIKVQPAHGGEMITVIMKAKDTIADVKVKIQEKRAFGPNQRLLFDAGFGGKQRVDDSVPLSYFTPVFVVVDQEEEKKEERVFVVEEVEESSVTIDNVPAQILDKESIRTEDQPARGSPGSSNAIGCVGGCERAGRRGGGWCGSGGFRSERRGGWRSGVPERPASPLP